METRQPVPVDGVQTDLRRVLMTGAWLYFIACQVRLLARWQVASCEMAALPTMLADVYGMDELMLCAAMLAVRWPETWAND